MGWFISLLAVRFAARRRKPRVPWPWDWRCGSGGGPELPVGEAYDLEITGEWMPAVFYYDGRIPILGRYQTEEDGTIVRDDNGRPMKVWERRRIEIRPAVIVLNEPEAVGV